MPNIEQILQKKLLNCRNIIHIGYTNTTASNISWLNEVCAEIKKFANAFHEFLTLKYCKTNEVIEVIFLCLIQINTCIRHMELTIKSEDSFGQAISASRQHFLDRMLWCVDLMKSTIDSILTMTPIIEESNFVLLMDEVLENLTPFSSLSKGSFCLNKAEEDSQAMFTSKEVRSKVDEILSHALAFANVALKEDKKIISILCQKIIRDCMAFQKEYSVSDAEKKKNAMDRRLVAMSLENSLLQLEDFINESLLRLVFHTFLDYSKLSIQKLRQATQMNIDDSKLDHLIADFDVNIDRTTQIGIFAIAFAPNIKIKTSIRSCLASLESLDSCIIPSLQLNSDPYSEILEQHFNEEINKFQVAIQEIIDSNAFCTSYLEILSEVITNYKELNKQQLTDFLEMGIILKDHLHLNSMHLQIESDTNKLANYEKFVLMLEECQAIMACYNQVDPQRILKRFKILRSVLIKFKDSITDSDSRLKKKTHLVVTFDEMCESQKLIENFGISPSTSTILYRNDNKYKKSASPNPQISSDKFSTEINEGFEKQHQKYLRRKDSLRTTMFKKAKNNETESLYKLYREKLDSVEMSAFLNDISTMSVGNPDNSFIK